MSYFETNFNRKDLNAIHETNRETVSDVLTNVERRHLLLQEALEYSGMKPELFHQIMREQFALHPKVIDEMTVGEISSLACQLGRAKLEGGNSARMDFPNATVVCDTAFTTISEWEIIRKLYIGGSDAPVILGKSPWRSPRGLYYDKRFVPKKTESERENPLFARGHFLEKDLVSLYAKTVGGIVIPETRMFASKTEPHCACNVDAFVSIKGVGLFVFEAKTTSVMNKKAWGDDDYKAVPEYYLPQVHHYLGVLDDPRIKGAHIGCMFVDDITLQGKYLGSGFDSEKVVFRRVDKDDLLEADSLFLCEEWWQHHISAQKLPERTDLINAEIEVQKDFEIGYPSDDDKVSLDEESQTLIEAYLALEEEKKRLEEAGKALKMKILDLLGEASIGTLGLGEGAGYYLISNKAVAGRKTLDKDILKIKYPDVYADEEIYKVSKPSTSFSVKLKAAN